MSQTNYYYTILRRDLFPFGPENPAYLIIQASHACMEMGRRLPAPVRGEGPSSMVLLEVADEQELFQTYRELKFNGMLEDQDFHMFFEPDHNTGFTAICTRPFEGGNNFFRGWKMFGKED